MARPLIDVIHQLDRKIRNLILQRDSLRLEVENLKKDVEEISDKLEEQTRLTENAQREAHFLSMSYRLADNPDDLIEARRTINALIRKIDRCIALLNDDPQM